MTKVRAVHSVLLAAQLTLLTMLFVVAPNTAKMLDQHRLPVIPDNLPMPQPPKKLDFGTNARVHEVTISTEHGLELYQQWINQAYSSFLACVGDNKLRELKGSRKTPTTERRNFRQRKMPIAVEKQFGECSKHADSVPLHAKCVSRLLKGQFKRKSRLINLAEKEWVGGFRLDDSAEFGKNASMLLGRRGKRAITQAREYQLKSPTGMMTPLGSIAKILMKQVLAAKNKTEAEIQP